MVKNPHSSPTNAGWNGGGGMKGNGGWKCVIWKKPHAKAGKNSGKKRQKREVGVVGIKKHTLKMRAFKNRSEVWGH